MYIPVVDGEVVLKRVAPQDEVHGQRCRATHGYHTHYHGHQLVEKQTAAMERERKHDGGNTM